MKSEVRSRRSEVGRIAAALCCALGLAGCVGATPGARSGWAVSLVTINVGGSHTAVDTVNNLQGTNVVQRHSLPVTADFKDATDLKVTP